MKKLSSAMKLDLKKSSSAIKLDLKKASSAIDCYLYEKCLPKLDNKPTCAELTRIPMPNDECLTESGVIPYPILCHACDTLKIYMENHEKFLYDFLWTQKESKDEFIRNLLNMKDISDDTAIFAFIRVLKRVFSTDDYSYVSKRPFSVVYADWEMLPIFVDELLKIVTNQIGVGSKLLESNGWMNFLRDFKRPLYQLPDRQITSKLIEYLDRLYKLRIQYIYWRDYVYPKKEEAHKLAVWKFIQSETRIERRLEFLLFLRYANAAFKSGKRPNGSKFSLAMISRGIITEKIVSSFM
jgi:hypothetical protein